MILADSKQILKLIQKKLLQQQIDPYLETHSQCPDCDAPLKAKDYTNRSFRTLFGTLAVHRGEPLTGIVYLRPGGRPPAQVMADVQALMDAEIDWTPSVIVVYRAGCLRLRRLSEGD